MNKVLRIIVTLPAIIFIVTGLRYAVDPVAAAAQFGMPLLEGVGRSTQIGDMGAYFLSLGIFILIALSTRRRVWFYPPAIIIGLTAVFRVIAWLVHDATLATDQILPEVIFTFLFLYAANRLTEKH